MGKKVIRNRSQITSTINPKLHEELRKVSETTDIPISKLLDRAIELLIKDFKEKGMY
jgi:Ribbon-helix-helix domain